MKKAILPILISVALSGQVLAQSDSAAKDKKAATPSTDTRGAAQTDAVPGASDIVVYESWTFYLDRLDRDTVSVYFDKGSSTLTGMERMRLTDWAMTMNNNRVNSAVVASWADAPYPEQSQTSLGKADRELADRRNNAIRDVLRSAGITRVETFSMAERPNWFQRTFQTDAAQIKGDAKNKGWDAKNEERLADILRRRGGPGKAVVIFRPNAEAGNLTGGR